LTVVVALLLSLWGCGGTAEPGAESTNAPAPTETSEAGSSPASTIVGSWQRVTTCEERVAALGDAGLGEFAAEHAAGEGWIPGVSSPEQIKDPTHPCEGAIPLTHGHFFTEDGLFGSSDDQSDQVDDGTYRVIDEQTIVVEKEFGDVTFHYQVQDDGTLLLEPVLPKCRKDGCFAAQWAVAVAYPGLPWEPTA
jgi:hypothetical protein